MEAQMMTIELEDLQGLLENMDRDKRPKKAKTLKNYISSFRIGTFPPMNPHNILREMEQRDWIFIGMNGEVIYNF
jgi:hypothetical protein